MNKTWLIIIGGVLIIFAAGIAQFFFPRSAVSPTSPTATSTPEQNGAAPQLDTKTDSVISADATKNVPDSPALHPFPLAKGDTVVSWNFKGAYADSPELTRKAQNEIERLSGQLATATSSAMILSVGIANQYELLGDGEKQYAYLERAIRTNVRNGLPWHNLGVLMERLGAFNTARTAYEKSTLVEPESKFYHYAYLEFLTSRMKDDAVSIEKAFTTAEKSIGQTPYLLELHAEWEKS